MAINDSLADMFSIIRNGQMAGLAVVKSQNSNLRANVLEVLKREGYIRDFVKKDVRKGVSQLEIELKYVDGRPAIQEIHKISKPGRRVYSSAGDLQKVNNGLGIAILSTPKGIKSDTEAKQEKLGGEVLGNVF